MLKELRPLFKENGFRASSQNFILEARAECWVIVNFHESRWGDGDETTFYVNVAACSKRWLGVEGRPAEKVPPSTRVIGDGAWSTLGAIWTSVSGVSEMRTA